MDFQDHFNILPLLGEQNWDSFHCNKKKEQGFRQTDHIYPEYWARK